MLGSPGIAQDKHYMKKFNILSIVNSWRVTNCDVSATGSWIDRNRRADQWGHYMGQKKYSILGPSKLALVLLLHIVSLSHIQCSFFSLVRLSSMNAPRKSHCIPEQLRTFPIVVVFIPSHPNVLKSRAPKRVGTQNEGERVAFCIWLTRYNTSICTCRRLVRKKLISSDKYGFVYDDLFAIVGTGFKRDLQRRSWSNFDW